MKPAHRPFAAPVLRQAHATPLLLAVPVIPAARLIGLCVCFLCALLWTHPTLAQADQRGAFGASVPQSATAALGSGFNAGVTQPEFLPVEEAYPLAVEQTGAQELRLVWQMPPGYYLYQHAFRFELERDTQAPEELPELQSEFPESITREDEYFGVVEVYYNSADITLRADGPVSGLKLVVSSQGCADAGLCYPPRTQRFSIGIPAAGESVAAVTELAPTLPRSRRQDVRTGSDVSRGVPSAGGGLGQILLMMLLAFTGGIILNLMPCVLPILSLKIVGFASADAEERHRHGLLYSAGVISSFLLVASLLFALRGAGQSIGWGFQLQSPAFVAALAYLFVVLGLGLSGALQLGNRFVNIGGGLADRGGSGGSFFTGVLAVVVASPCTAPFMGTALGYALVQPPIMGLSVFFALGLGMAAPMLLLSYSELARRLMPKPGPWMERLKQALAFPLYATALWLFWVVGRQAGVDVMAASLLGALLLALGLWLWSSSWVARAAAVGCVALAFGTASWRPDNPGTAASSLPEGSIAYSADKLDSLRAQGLPVFVDVTADWCITCLANERSVLSSEVIKQAFSDAGVTYMVADWTDYDTAIADFVASHGRSGIPLYVLYTLDSPPQMLPQLLRKQLMLDVLQPLLQERLASAGLQDG